MNKKPVAPEKTQFCFGMRSLVKGRIFSNTRCINHARKYSPSGVTFNVDDKLKVQPVSSITLCIKLLIDDQ